MDQEAQEVEVNECSTLSTIHAQENITAPGKLYLFVHHCMISSKDHKPREEFFGGKELSSEWDRYATPEETRNRVTHDCLKNRSPNNYGVISICIAALFGKKIDCEHFPYNYNRSHSHILGDKKSGSPKLRLILRDLCEWEIKYTP